MSIWEGTTYALGIEPDGSWVVLEVTRSVHSVHATEGEAQKTKLQLQERVK